jgi:hypothetical protein
MGLDTYASSKATEIALPAAAEKAFNAADIELCGGMFSGAGGSFRGKVYAGIVHAVSSVSLYQEWIPPQVVHEMMADFDALSPEAVEEMAEQHGHSKQEVLALQQFFRICAAHNLGLIGWW